MLTTLFINFDFAFYFKELIPSLTILVAFAGLIYAWQKDRLWRRKEYADRIRKAASLVTAKLERWVELAVRLYEELQPLITETDVLLAKEQNAIATRDYFWRELTALRVDTSRRILDEQIEIAYADLYGFDDRIRELFLTAVGLLKETDGAVYTKLLEDTQSDVLDFADHKGKVDSADLGNTLRRTCARLGKELEVSLREILNPFREEMIALMKTSDSQLYEKSFNLKTWELVFASCLAKRKERSAAAAKESKKKWGPPGCEPPELFIPNLWSLTYSPSSSRTDEMSLAKQTDKRSTKRAHGPRERVGVGVDVRDSQEK
jgi:hypothetical protein